MHVHPGQWRLERVVRLVRLLGGLRWRHAEPHPFVQQSQSERVWRRLLGSVEPEPVVQYPIMLRIQWRVLFKQWRVLFWQLLG